MFENPISFDGRIRRIEFGISVIINLVFGIVINIAREKAPGVLVGLYLAYIPVLWFVLAQGAKRCHDMGNSGWYQIIPFYVFWMLFAEGDYSENKYGANPKLHELAMAKSTNRVFMTIGGIALIGLTVYFYSLLFESPNPLGNDPKLGLRYGPIPIPHEATDSLGNIMLWFAASIPFVYGIARLYYAMTGRKSK